MNKTIISEEIYSRIIQKYTKHTDVIIYEISILTVTSKYEFS